jgi:uncharacterized phage infection (PIP) family protein YhgE
MKAIVALLAVCLIVPLTSCTNNSKLQEDLKAANSTIELLRAQAVNTPATIQSLQQQIGAANSMIQSLQQQVNSGNISNTSLQAQIKSAQTQLDIANLTILSLQNTANTTNKSLQSLQTQLTTANSTIQSLRQQLDAATANLTALQKQLGDAITLAGVLNQRIDWLSKIAPAPPNVIPVDCDYLYGLAKDNEVAVNTFYRYQLVQMSHLIVVQVTDTPGKVKLKTLGGTEFLLTFKNTTGLEKLLPNMQITVYGTCKGVAGVLPDFGPDFVLVSIDSW